MNIFFVSALSLWVCVTALSLFAIRRKRNDVADVFWGPGFVVVGLAAAATKGFSILGLTEILICGAIFIWALRLSLHIGRRFAHESVEDSRYQKMRAGWGEAWRLQSYLKVFLLQAVILYIVALPLTYTIATAPRDTTNLVLFGFGVWIFGFIFGALADEQLRRFKAEPANKGRLMDQGLWSWSRHPNYFGEVTQWWGIFLMAVTVESLWLIVSPVLITFLILKVSGISLMESAMASRPGFAEYQDRVSAFLPRPPRNRPKANTNPR